MSIQPLPSQVVAQIKSSVVITSLNAVVLGLVQNALDADASKLIISVDYGRGNCTVEDNGLGIPPADFASDGGLGKLHFTSRYPPQPTHHGRHGAFLASVAALSLLSITSRHRAHVACNALLLHNARVLARHVPAPPDQRLVAFSAGTRVAVRDLFGAMPVRVKQRAAALARAGTASHLDQLLRYLVATLLACPRVLVVTLRPARGEPSVTLRTSTADLRTRLPALLAPAGLYEAGGGAAVWVPVEASGSGLSLRGCICLVPVATKKLQFILLGIRPVLSEEQPNVLYEEINRIFARSSFGVGEEAGDVVDKPLRKGIDRWPMFCMQVTAKQKYAPVAVGMHGLLDDSDTSPSLRAIIDLLRVTVYEFLKQHLFRPGPIAAHDAVGYAQVKGTKSRSASPPKSPAPIVAWHTSVSACPAAAPAPPGTADPMPASPPASTADGAAPLPKPPRAPLIDRTGMVMRPPFDVPRRAPNPAAVARSPTPAPTSPAAVEGDGPVSNTASETVVWVDPVTKIRSLIDARTGFVVNKEPKRLTLRPVLPAPDTGGGASATSPSPWLEKLLGSWENPVFERTEAPIPRVPDVAEVLGASDPTGHACCHGIKSVTVGDQSDSTIMSSLGRISRSGLAGADVVAQVDRKFILAKVPRDGQVAKTADPAASHMLVLIDQHAADERCRVEDLMRGYFPPGNPIRAATAALERPLRFDLARQEGDLLSRYQGHFAHWGIVFELFRPDEQQKHAGHGPAKKVRVDMQALPPSILERCRLEPRLLVELLRKELWRLHDGAAPAQQAVAVDAGHCEAAGTDWVARFHGCPQGILDLINSRSCRSAIMFNDELSKAECRDLVARLARCAFPFQCAHGRPSMVPLVTVEQGLGFVPDVSGGVGGGTEGFWKQLRAWGGASSQEEPKR